jgi:hypothetical protein
MEDIIEKSKKLFLEKVKDFGSDPYHLLPHVPDAEKWVEFLLKNHPEADKEVALISIWLHDIGHYPLPTNIDHAIRGEAIAREFLSKEKFDKEKLQKVLHCIRSHRCKDVLPKTIEAKIIACADSASHITDFIYCHMIKMGDLKNAKEKLERDFRDISVFPEVKDKLSNLYMAWKELLKEFEKLDF